MHNGQYKAIGLDPTGKFVFETISEDKLEERMGADDNITYLSLEDYEKLEAVILVGQKEATAHLASLADAARMHWEEDGAEDYFETELVRTEDFLSGRRWISSLNKLKGLKMSKGYKVVCYMRVTPVDSEGEPMDIDEAQAELNNLSLMQPENIYRIEPCEDDEAE